MTSSEIYSYVKSAVAKKNVKKLGNVAISIYVTDEGATGEFYIAVKDGELEIENFKYEDYTAHLSISSADLKKIVDGKKVSYSFDDGDDAQGKALIAALVATAPAKAPAKAEAKKAAVNRGILYCSGLIAGEGLVGIVLAAIAAAGLNTDMSQMINLGPIGAIVLFALLSLSLVAVTRKKK